jgi:hypothetical protein
VVTVGDTVFTLPVPNPELHVYADAPPAVNVDDAPAQIDAGFTVRVTVGLGFTVIVTAAEPEHPKLLVPVTVYAVVNVGATVFGLPVPRVPLQL